MKQTRRQFSLNAVGLAFSSFLGSGAKASQRFFSDAAQLVFDPNGILDLPEGFSYEVISSYGERMNDGNFVPDAADGMGCIPITADYVALIRNHELSADQYSKSGLTDSGDGVPTFDRSQDRKPLAGGTTTVIYSTKTRTKICEYRSLAGTLRNCAGGTTPWGSWLTCEESVSVAGEDGGADHGYVFEVYPEISQTSGAIPLKDMGRFNHEAAAVDPATGIVYMTEDRNDGLLYRYVPFERGQLAAGGKLQALAIEGSDASVDTRNWDQPQIVQGQQLQTRWIDLENVTSPDDDLRLQGAFKGAAVFARGEGIHIGNGEFYFCCTSGGHAELGQIMRYQPSVDEGSDDEAHSPGILELFYESRSAAEYNFGDNLTVAPQGYLIVCEDQYTDPVSNHLRIVTPNRQVIPFARLLLQTELAGACFSPDGSTLFVNLYSPSKTLAIRGPWSNYG